MFQEAMITFSSHNQNINLYPSYTQFCQGQKNRYAVPTAVQAWINDNQNFRRDSLLNCTSYSVDEGFEKFWFSQNGGYVKSKFIFR